MQTYLQEQKQRYYLPVIPSVEQQKSNKDGKGILILSPPPIAMPWGLGRTRKLTGKDLTEAWLLDEQEGELINLSECMIFRRKNRYYAEVSFQSCGIISLTLFGCYICLMCFFIGYIFNVFTIFFISGVIFLLILICIIYFSYENYPTTIFNRERDEIYIYSNTRKEILIKKFTTTIFIFSDSSSWSSLDIICDNEKNIQDTKNQFCIDGSRGLTLLIPTWEYIRRYMEPGDGYKELPEKKKDPSHLLPFMGLASRLDEKYFSPPHRWPPEIERLLWPENKDAPLPHGWQYDTWIPYDIPKGGFDNTALLREREEQLRHGAKNLPGPS
ncbi:hypothetical protein CE91St38_08940 [Desulfovibrionaceae bacterium]|nr:hypothetical protein CE91St38_08940 [Desulfovibrionaceae bacterium]GKI11438.1 hypothetical protein CE91St39_08920 [Desulfovibrionaceae bacterium]